ncbi:MAG: response regulator, partial [Proteobacteria bacterium]|nr:response regulator [Pseudomonadota bacterium]
MQSPLLLPKPDGRQGTNSIEDDRDKLKQASRWVLVIDGDASFAKIILQLAHDSNYQCIVAQTAAEGLEIARRLTPDAIILDLMLPDKSGLTVLDQLKHDAVTKHILVQIISAYDFTEKALRMGAIGYVLKPTKLEQLKTAFKTFDYKLSQKIKRVLIVEDDKPQRDSMVKLISTNQIEITAVSLAKDALKHLKTTKYDCMVMDIKLPDMSGEQLLTQMSEEKYLHKLPPVIVYTGCTLSKEDEHKFTRYSRSIIVKGAKSLERLLDEVGLFLHSVDSDLALETRDMLTAMR